MFNTETFFQNGWPALLLMVIFVSVLVFIRLVVPYLIRKFQRKRAMRSDIDT